MLPNEQVSYKSQRVVLRTMYEGHTYLGYAVSRLPRMIFQNTLPELKSSDGLRLIDV